jgi:TonB family protein
MSQSMIYVSRFAGVCMLLAGLTAHAQDADPAARLASAASLTSLNQVDQRPWHLKLDITIFDDKGENPSQGTIEVWHAGTDERTVYTFGDATSTRIKHDGKSYGMSSGPSLPFEADEVLQQVLHPGPEPDELNDSKPELRKQKFGKVSLNCIMLTQPIKGADTVPLGLFPTYCLDANDLIRSTYNFGGETVVLNGIGKFLDHDVPTQLDIVNGQIKIASSKIITLATYIPQPDEFVPAADMKAIGGEARVAGGVIAGSRISFTQPVYPEGAKERHESGTVTLRAIIGRDGHIRLLRPTSATDPDFVIAAIAAVRRWTYKPYLLNGEPTEVDTTITVNFALNGGY